jgi:hypothetical protein
MTIGMLTGQMGSTYGVLKKGGLAQFNKNAEKTFTMPVSSLKQIVEHLKKTLNIDHVRVIGEPLCKY